MSKEFDIDTPADMSILNGSDDDNTDPASAAEDPAAEHVAEKSAEEIAAEEAATAAAEPEAAEAAVAEEEQTPAKRDAVIPRARFDDVNAKLHAQREENERLRAELDAKVAAPTKASGTVDVDALEEAYFDAMIGGDKDAAKTIRAQINAEIYRRAEESSTATVSRALSEREATTEFARAVSKTVEAYPFLDSASSKANADAIGEVVEWRDFYIAKGDSPAAALQKAAAKVAPMYVAEPSKDQSAEPVADKRQQQALVNGAKAAAAQPPRVDAGVGNRAIPAGDEIISSQDKWEKASDSERLRYLS